VGRSQEDHRGVDWTVPQKRSGCNAVTPLLSTTVEQMATEVDKLEKAVSDRSYT